MEKTYDILLNNDSSQQINDIKKNYFIEDENEPINNLPNTNSINIIIGSNNSGKSRFMRYLMSCKNLIGIQKFIELDDFIKNYNQKVSSFNEENIDLPREQFEINNQRTIYIGGNDKQRERYDFLGKNRLKTIDTSVFSALNQQFKHNQIINQALKTKIGVSDPYFNTYPEVSIKDFTDSKSYYIPTLRSAHSLFQQSSESFSKIENDIYLDTLRKYYPDLNDEVEIFTGLHLYKEILNSRNADRSTRQLFEKFERFISQNFFGNKHVDIVAEFNKDHSLSGKNDSEFISIHIEGEIGSRKLYELGDGIQAIIILMYKIFMADNNSIIFVDEPELNLHPGMQRLFLDQISSNKDLIDKGLTYFISTHSNHFLDLTLEKEHISIYSFSYKSTENEVSTFNIRNVNAGDNSILKNLGVNNSSVFLANCSIWVEGISDRNYIKSFLKSYTESLGKKAKILKEDIDYAFFEYSGSNIEHYVFDNIVSEKEEILSDINSLALSNRIFLLADSDNVSKTTKKGKRLKELNEIKSDNFFPYIIWNIREIENLLTKEIWQEVLIHLCNKNLVKKYEQRIKNKIIQALEELDPSEYKKEYVGEFLNTLSTKLGKIGSTLVLNESNYKKLGDGRFGTLINKRELSEIISEKNFSWEILKQSKEIESLITKIYEFIAQV